MPEIAVIADDFTGALDTGVQFAAAGYAAYVVAGMAGGLGSMPPDTEVLVIDTESRHLPPQQAGQAVGEAATEALMRGAQLLYKKTDSALRGNVGAELEAILAACGQPRLVFAPSFPELERVTRRGVHHVAGRPVAESVFGRDPFSPVRHSFIPSLIAAQAGVAVHLVPGGGALPADAQGILLCDAETDAELAAAARKAQKEGVRLFAGCAGFAKALLSTLPAREKPPRPAPAEAGLVVFSGSLNPIALHQAAAAQKAGFPALTLSAAEKLDPAFTDSAAYTGLEEKAFALFTEHRRLVIETVAKGARHSEPEGMTAEEARGFIARNMGKIALCLWRRLGGVWMVVGGDTLFAMLNALSVRGVVPLEEIEPGVVLSRVALPKGPPLFLITKSGGLGGSNAIVRAARYLENLGPR